MCAVRVPDLGVHGVDAAEAAADGLAVPAAEETFHLSWPAEGIKEVSARVDASAIIAAATRAIELWPDPRPLPPAEEDVVI